MTDNELLDPEQRIKELEAQIEALIADRAKLSAAHKILMSENENLQQTNKALEVRLSELENELESLRAERPSLSLDQLGIQLKEALAAVQTAPAPEGSTLEYAVRNARIEIKTVIDFDDEGRPILRFPAAGERVDPGRLTTMSLAFAGISKPEVDLSALTPVPTLLGLTREGAETRLTRAGLVTGEISEQESPSATGTVVAQDPEGGVYISADTPVDFTLAIPIKIEVPQVVGYSFEEAKKRLVAVRLQPGAVTSRKSDEPVGTVLAQSPKAGTRVDVQSTVDMVLAQGPEKIQMPALTGKKLAEAREILDKLGLEEGRIQEQRSDQPPETILRQNPPARSLVEIGTAVDLWVARTVIERALPTPNLVRMERAAAIKQLQEAGWSYTLSATKSDDFATDRAAGWFDRVTAQSPEPGEPVPSTHKMVQLEILAAPDPVENVHGVGPKFANRLTEANITSVGDLTLADPTVVVQALETSENAAKELIAQASDLNDAIHLEGIEALGRAAALLLVMGGNVRSPQMLSQQNATELNRKLQAVSREEMPSIVKDIQPTQRLAATWIEAARDFVKRQ